MNCREPYLSKSRYIAGLQCAKRLWLGWHEPASHDDAAENPILATGIEIGIAARSLFPRGILIEEEAQDHQAAVERTRRLLEDPSTTAVFEAAFTFERIRIRADVMERLPNGTWRLAEVKSSTSVKPEHLDDIAVQLYVIRGSGVPVSAAELVHVDNSYVRGPDRIDWTGYFARDDVTEEVEELLGALGLRTRDMHRVLRQREAPSVRPSGHCFYPYECEFWAQCTADKPADWVFNLPRLGAEKFALLDGDRIASIRDIPDDFPLSPTQQRTVEVMVSGREFVSEDLGSALAALAPPVSYLDFETFSPAIPLYAGTRPYQRLPFQWSLHHQPETGALLHREFLADGSGNPRREFALTLVEAVASSTGPVVVYSPFEASVLCELADRYPDLATPLGSLIARLVDLLPIVRTHFEHPALGGSYSLKVVAPTISAGITYDDLDVAGGGDASATFYRLSAERSLDARRARTIAPSPSGLLLPRYAGLGVCAS